MNGGITTENITVTPPPGRKTEGMIEERGKKARRDHVARGRLEDRTTCRPQNQPSWSICPGRVHERPISNSKRHQRFPQMKKSVPETFKGGSRQKEQTSETIGKYGTLVRPG